jgi:hypothetical protein
MAIAKNPRRSSNRIDAEDSVAEQFIAGAGDTRADADREKLIQTPIRFSPSLLKRIDTAAKKRGLGRSSWMRYAASRVLDEDGA